MGTWEHGNTGTGGGGSREMAGIRGAGRKHEGLPNGLSGETGTCPVLSHCAPCLTSIRVAPNPSWGLLNRSRMMGCKPLPLRRAPEKGPSRREVDLDGGSSGLRRKPRRIQPVPGSPRKGRERGDRGARVFEAFNLAEVKGDA
jgi:hypothetical protein